MSIKDLKPNENNPRTITKEAFERLKAKIQRNPDGLTANKIVHKDGIIIAGNQRWRAINDLKLELDPEWFKDVSGWTNEQVREYLITSNVSDGEWDWDVLANDWSDLPLAEWGLPTPITVDDFGMEFELPDGDKTTPGTMTFTLAPKQAAAINEALKIAKTIDGETYGNSNQNGNALYWMATAWLAQSK